MARKPVAKKKTFVGYALDKSGSMGNIKTEIINVFNTERKNLIKNASKGGTTRVSMVQFGAHDPKVEVIFNNKAAKNIPILNETTYRPDAMTPMYDGVGQLISLLEKHDDGGEDTAFLVVIFSDGLENDSREWTSQMISSKVKELEATGRWTFVYFGANQDLKAAQKSLGISSAANTLDWDGNTVYASAVLSAGSSKYFTARSAGVTYTADYTSVN